MQPEAPMPVTPSDTAEPTTLVLLCRDLLDKALANDLADAALWLTTRFSHVLVRWKDGLCHTPIALKLAAREVKAQRLVLGLCSSHYPELEVQAHVRKAGLDPLGLQVLDLGSCWDGTAASSMARLLLAGAVARARAFSSSRPENLKAVLLPLQQKMSRRALFTLPPVAYLPVPSIDRSACAAGDGCDQCVAACPHGALEKDGDVILVDRARCQSCGACLRACPHRAVQLPGWSAPELEAQLAWLLNGDVKTADRGVLFLCKKTTLLPGPGWLPVNLPCMASLPMSAILQALVRGATEVALLPCGEKCSSASEGWLEGRVRYCQDLLALLGDDPGKVRVVESGVPAMYRASEPFIDADDSPVPLRLYGSGADAEAVLALASRFPGSEGRALPHPQSPLGVVSIHPQTCTACGACAGACPTGALSLERHDEQVAIIFDQRLCTACGRCVSLCPEKAAEAITVAPTTDLTLLASGRRTLLQDREAHCQRCGSVVASGRLLERLATMLGSGFNETLLGSLCPACRGLPLP